MALSWKVLFKLLNDVGKVYDGRSRYLRFFKGLREIERLYRAHIQENEPIESVHKTCARLALELCRTNGAMWIKVAQYLSCRPDLLPKEYIDVLSELQTASNHSTSKPFSAVQADLLKCWGERWESKFEAFNIIPVAIGSIAQVYRATLADQTEVCVKVRVPGVEMLYEQDIIVLRAMAKCLEPFYKEFDVVVIVEEIITATKAELDFTQELSHLLEYQQLAKMWPIATPQVMQDLSSKQILVTQWLSAKPLQLFLQDNQEKSRVGDALESVTLSVLEDIFMHGFYHGDPHPGNIMLGQQLYLIDFGLIGRLNQQQRYHYAQLLMAMMGQKSQNYAILFDRAGFKAQDSAIFETVGIYIQELQDDQQLNIRARLQSILDALRKNKIILPQGFVGIMRVVLLLSGLYQQVDLDFESVFAQHFASPAIA